MCTSSTQTSISCGRSGQRGWTATTIALGECASANAALAHLGRDGDYSPLPQGAVEMAADWMREAQLQETA